MIWVKASQVSYDNEIAELVKVFYPGEQVAALSKSGLGVEDGKIHADLPVEDMVLETGYTREHSDSLVFFAFMQRGGTLLCEHKQAVPIQSMKDIDSLRSRPNQEK
jgi:hypothetical protein